LRSKDQGYWKGKNVFLRMFVKGGSIYVKPRPKWSAAHSTHIIEFTSPANSGNSSFL